MNKAESNHRLFQMCAATFGSLLLSMLLLSGCGRVSELTDQDLTGRWEVTRVKGSTAPSLDPAKPFYLLLKSDHRFEGQLMKGTGFCLAAGEWELKKKDRANPLAADTDWSLHLEVTEVGGVKTKRYETDLACIGGRLIDVWNGPDEQVSYKKTRDHP